jgi:arsenate reductase-like glutaredoxin family protein
MYREISTFRYDPEEAVQMFSDALRKLDENTVNYMIEELRAEIVEKDNLLEFKDGMIESRESALREKDNIIKKLEKQIVELTKKSVEGC